MHYVDIDLLCACKAIEAMRKAYQEELEKSQKVQQNGASTDITKLRAQFK